MSSGNHLIDGDDGQSCQSPNHNEATCKICQERKRYELVKYCPNCCEYYGPDGEIYDEPAYATCESVVCGRCVALELSEGSV